MKYSVEYQQRAEDDLADVWAKADDKALVTGMVNHLEKLMGFDPKQVGEARESPLTRVVLSPPIGMWFDVIEDDLKVLVLSVWALPS